MQRTKRPLVGSQDDFSPEDFEFAKEAAQIATELRDYYDPDLTELKSNKSPVSTENQPEPEKSGSLIKTITQNEQLLDIEFQNHEDDAAISHTSEVYDGPEEFSDIERLEIEQRQLDQFDFNSVTSDADTIDDLENPVEIEVFEQNYIPNNLAPYDWDLIETEEIDEYEEFHVREELSIAVETEGKLSHEQRILQIALEMTQNFGWDDEGRNVLIEILTWSRWNKTRQSLSEAVRANYNPKEILLAHQIRLLWLDHTEFAVSIQGYNHHFLSWPLALRIVMLFRGYPDISEIECFLSEVYETWWTHEELLNRYSSFHDYLHIRAINPINPHLATPSLLLGDECLEEYFEYDAGRFSGFNLPLQEDLESYGLIPRIFHNKINDAFIFLHPDGHEEQNRIDEE